MVFRKGETKLEKFWNHELLDVAGMGDNICRAPSIKEKLKQPQVHMTLWVPEAHLELFRYWFGAHPRVHQIGTLEQGYALLSDDNKRNSGIWSKGYWKGFRTKGITIPFRPHTYHRVHPVDHGDRLIRNADLKDRSYLPILPDAADISKFNLPDQYAVLACGHTWDNRVFHGKTANQISDYLLEKGITPVFLGKKNMPKNAKISWTGIDRSKGIDLLSEGNEHKTTLLEASVIMRHARMVIGVDQGLHHLAGCSGDVPIVVGYTITEPETRMPIRNNSYMNVFPVTPGPELECRFCMSNMDIPHNFEHCLYGDNKCTSMLTFSKFKKAIDKALEVERG